VPPAAPWLAALHELELVGNARSIVLIVSGARVLDAAIGAVLGQLQLLHAAALFCGLSRLT
jgi:hypothetical protein